MEPRCAGRSPRFRPRFSQKPPVKKPRVLNASVVRIVRCNSVRHGAAPRAAQRRHLALATLPGHFPYRGQPQREIRLPVAFRLPSGQRRPRSIVSLFAWVTSKRDRCPQMSFRSVASSRRCRDSSSRRYRSSVDFSCWRWLRHPSRPLHTR
jgi:hypothetical protein